MKLLCLTSLLLLSQVAPYGCSEYLELEDRFYRTIDTAIPCFRLTDATRQIGCSASSTNTRGVLYYIATPEDLNSLLNDAPHAPYVALMEPEMFNSSTVLELKSRHRVNGILVRYTNGSDTIPQGLYEFSPERRCPNQQSGYDGTCNVNDPWNPHGSELSFTDFGDFPVFALLNENFEEVLSCFLQHNTGLHGSLEDYPLCSVELTADMFAVKDTPTCFRRAEKVLTLLLNGETLCDPLGDRNVWGALFPLPSELEEDKTIIMMTTKIDSTAFFPGLAYGANNELAGIATLLAVLETLGRLKKEGTLVGTGRPLMYTFFHGESWDYIGSSRMVYDMEKGEFPYGEDYPLKLRMSDIGEYLELSQLGLPRSGGGQTNFYVHNITASPIVDSLFSMAKNLSSLNLTIQQSSVASDCNCSRGPDGSPCRLPPASLQRFLRKDPCFSGAVLSDFDTQYGYKFFGSRFDSLSVLSGETDFDNATYDETIQNLANIATVVANTVLDLADPKWANGTTRPEGMSSDPDVIRQVLYCFLVNASCDLFQSILIRELASLLPVTPPGRYITVDRQDNTETVLIFQLVAYYTGVNITVNSSSGEQGPALMECRTCQNLMDDSVKLYNISWMQGPDFQTSEQDLCLCLNSSTFFHEAKSPAFKEKDYNSKEYSTWAESTWSAVSLRIYLVTYTLQEVAFFLCGLVMTAVSLALALQCRRKGRCIFKPEPLGSCL